MKAVASPSRAIGPKMSKSRVIRVDLVMTLTGWLNRVATSSTPRVIFRSRSSG